MIVGILDYFNHFYVLFLNLFFIGLHIFLNNNEFVYENLKTEFLQETKVFGPTDRQELFICELQITIPR